jgi:hypothetical protein
VLSLEDETVEVLSPFAATSDDDFLQPNVKISDKQLRKIRVFDFIFLKF